MSQNWKKTKKNEECHTTNEPYTAYLPMYGPRVTIFAWNAADISPRFSRQVGNSKANPGAAKDHDYLLPTCTKAVGWMITTVFLDRQMLPSNRCGVALPTEGHLVNSIDKSYSPSSIKYTNNHLGKFFVNCLIVPYTNNVRIPGKDHNTMIGTEVSTRKGH